ncbi:TIGR02530 family flagellar biosynthesis protein [Evansella halocellulosilytica]|uniref:TIGR02530 family flagellar biosynthesis protein n=1 Tax=Evansella halocellulosilytica TaxID=2011013 RepID=UPI000BB69B84|nr:TIGR02530 family flagellar biosynthesis protein [Evansella halocellulosilytica]
MGHKIMPHHLQQPLPKPAIKSTNKQSKPSVSFQKLLNESLDHKNDLKISKHAEKRLQDRGIDIRPETWEEIHDKVKAAKDKGVVDSLVVTNSAALIVSAKNETVITAMDREEAETQVFTNINGAILIDG